VVIPRSLEILISVFASDSAKASDFAKATSDKPTDKKASPGRQDDDKNKDGLKSGIAAVAEGAPSQ